MKRIKSLKSDHGSKKKKKTLLGWVQVTTGRHLANIWGLLNRTLLRRPLTHSFFSQFRPTLVWALIQYFDFFCVERQSGIPGPPKNHEVVYLELTTAHPRNEKRKYCSLGISSVTASIFPVIVFFSDFTLKNL